jgi:hypothetical protein
MIKLKKLREKGVLQNIIQLTETHVTYLAEGKKFPLTAEENVRLDYYLKLVFLKSIPPDRLKTEFPVHIGTKTLRADIVAEQLFEKDFPKFFLIVECKRKGLSPADMEKAKKQAFSYERQLGADFVVVTDGDEHFCYETVFTKHGTSHRPVHDFPRVGARTLLIWRLRKWLFRLKKFGLNDGKR